MAMETGVNQSIEAQHRSTLQEVDWTEVREPGCYVDAASGDLFRIPKEALMVAASPLITRESRGASRLRYLSADPFMPTVNARLLCAQHNIKPNF
jgi:hypothetical protein